MYYVLQLKANETNKHKNYRPIIYLSITEKMLTSIFTERTYSFQETNNILPTKKSGCKKRCYGCKEQLFLNKMLLENSRSNHNNLSTAWIDYRKAFESARQLLVLLLH